MRHTGHILQMSWEAASAMLLIPGLKFDILCHFEAEDTFKFYAHDASSRYYTCFIQLYRHRTKAHTIIDKLPLNL